MVLQVIQVWLLILILISNLSRWIGASDSGNCGVCLKWINSDCVVPTIVDTIPWHSIELCMKTLTKICLGLILLWFKILCIQKCASFFTIFPMGLWFFGYHECCEAPLMSCNLKGVIHFVGMVANQMCSVWQWRALYYCFSKLSLGSSSCLPFAYQSHLWTKFHTSQSAWA